MFESLEKLFLNLTLKNITVYLMNIYIFLSHYITQKEKGTPF